MEPITPKEFTQSYGSRVPDLVIEVVNDIIKGKATYENKTSFNITQKEVVDALISKGVNRQSIFDNHMLDFEPTFRSSGWKVEWNKGAYFEDDTASHWKFST